MIVRGDFYTIQQAAELLDMPTEKVHGLLRKGKLKGGRCEETGRWLLDIRSVHRQRVLRVGLPEASDISTATMPDATPPKSRSFDSDLLVLAIIGGVTLLAAGYTLVPLLFR
jgi:hypothetical protein